MANVNERAPEGKPPVSAFHANAQMWARVGWRVFPCEPNGKRPLIKDWNTAATHDLEQINKWWTQWPTANIAIVPGEDRTILDVEPEAVARLPEFQAEHGTIPDTFTVKTARDGRHYFFNGASDRRIKPFKDRTGKKWAVDIIGRNSYIIASGSVIGGKEYTILHDADFADVPAWLAEVAAKCKHEPTAAAEGQELDLPFNIARAEAYLKTKAAPAPGNRDNATYAVACTLKDLGIGALRMLDMLLKWAPLASDFTIDDLKRIIKSAFENGENAPGCFALKAGLAETFGKAIANVPPVERSSDEPCCVPPGSETHLSCYIAQKYSSKLRYVAKWGQWLMFDGSRWRQDDTLAMWEMCKREVADYATRVFDDNPAMQRKLASKASIAGVESLTRSDRDIAATTDQWDRDPMLLNTPGGVVDLRTGSLRPAEPGDYLTKITAVAPGGECPQFLQFLGQITAGDRGLQEYLQRAFGYALTGTAKEHVMFFGYGTGGNGKGVLLNTLIGIMNEYALHAPVEVFTATKFDRHTTELARLQGARLVVSTETEKGRQWAEARIKSITGGDPITARYMRQDDFTYIPQFKLFITGNHMPVLSNVDEAMRRRINMIPFTVTIPPSQRDPDLPERLRSEWGGILAWGIQGCLDWQKGGLRAPAAVLEATESYFADNDPFEAWWNEWCRLDNANAWEGTTALFESYQGHCRGTNSVPVDQKQFVRKLEGRGLLPRVHSRTRRAGFVGISLEQL